MKLRKLFILVIALILLLAVGAPIAYRTIPAKNTALTHFDTLVVLGTPANTDGTPSPEQRERTLEAVREYKTYVADHIIFTGGAAHNQFVEADVMERLAIEKGVPANAIVSEVRRAILSRTSTTANASWKSITGRASR